MRNQVNPKHQFNPKNAKKRRKLWPLVTIVAAIIVLIGGLIVWRLGRTDTRTPRFDISVENPMPARYADKNPIVMSVGTNKIATPQINTDRQVADPTPLRIYYNLMSGDYAPAMRMDIDDAELVNAIKMTPRVRGTWSHPGPNTLVFTPATNWPADTRFRVKIARRLFNSDVRVNSRTVRFETPAQSATIDSFDVYPTGKPGMVSAIAVATFTYATDLTARDVTVTVDGRRIDAEISLDTARRTAIITTAPIQVTDASQRVRLTLTGNGPRVSADTTIAAADNFFKISDITTAAVDDENGVPQQLIILSTTAGAAATTDWGKHIHAYLLPRTRNADEKSSHHWASDEITPEVLEQSKQLTLRPTNLVSPAGAYQYAFVYEVSDKNTRYIYVDVTGGINSDIGFDMKNGADKIMRVPYPARQVKMMGDGALLTLGGDRKIGIVARGGADRAWVNVAKVKASEINHLISQTYNVFTNLDFKSWSFGTDDMSVVFTKTIPFADASPARVNYASLDLGAYLDKTANDKTGIFIIQTGPTQSQADYSDRRLVLMTDLGMIRKINANGMSSVFVSHLTSGQPANDITVSVLGRNGNPIWSGTTNAGGRVNVPVFGWNEYRGAREPVAIVARRGDDVSFIPYDASGPQVVEYSKFDTGGLYGNAGGALTAYLFSDRGIYRPGEEVIIGAIVRERNFKSLSGIPVRVVIDDARGHTIADKKLTLTVDGMFDVRQKLENNSALGEYSVTLYSLTSRGANDDVIGRATFQVQEFTPDTMKINVTIPGATDTGWLSINDMTANVSLHNLFGTPAQNRRITASVTLTPTPFTFSNFPGYAFTPNVIENAGLSPQSTAAPRPITVQLPDTQTNANGDATLNIQVDQPIAPGTYALNLTVRGFDGDAGRHVQKTATTRVSDASYLVGWRADGNLDYVNRDTARQVHVVAVQPDGQPSAQSNLTLRVIARENLTSLVKDTTGYYKYQSVTRDRIVKTGPFDIPTSGRTITLDTQTPGTYTVQILDADGRIYASVPYFVAGDANVAMTRDTSAELKIKLNKTEYAPGDDIAVSITAPYSGTGLITIERDQVYAYQWFTAAGTTSVQHIRVPDDFDGTGYVNVSFVRDINSRDIFTSPYTYAVAPFTARAKARKINVTLAAPDVIRDKKLTVKYTTSQSARLMIFAVDAGILQVARHAIPNPLKAFYQKYALNVQTYQILSLLLPEYKILREFAKTGGGDYDGGLSGGAPATNPFGRAINAPVAFYSGIIEARANTPGTITFDIPDYFNGDMRIYAVAANKNAVGAASTHTLVQSPIIITPSLPMVAAPGDTFTGGAIITNMTDTPDINATVSVSENLELTSGNTEQMTVARGAEKLMRFGLRAQNVGPGTVDIHATSGEAQSTSRATMTVRPIYPFESNIQTGVINSARTKIRDFNLDMYPSARTRQIYIARGAAAWMRPLMHYLQNYTFDCTEQLTSRAMPYAVMGNDKILGTTPQVSRAQIAETIAKLRGRQNGNGSFALWPNGGPDENTVPLTAYVTHFLMLARDNGYSVPAPMLSRAIDYLRDVAGRPISDTPDAINHAWAIYLITRGGFVTTNYISAFEEYVTQNMPNWAQTIAGPYIAAAYEMMKQSDRASEIIAQYVPGTGAVQYISMFDNTTANDSMAAYILNKYFGRQNHAWNAALVDYINSGNYSSYTSAMAILGLAGADSTDALPTLTVMGGQENLAGHVDGDAWIADIPADIQDITIDCPECDARPLTWTIIQSGYPRTLRPMHNGIEVTRHYYNAAGNRITSAPAGSDVTVKITVRARDGSNQIPNVVISDLLPGALSVIPGSLTGPMTYYENREDRVLIFADVTRAGTEFTYSATVTTPGEFAVPPISAASLYNPAIRAVGHDDRFIVTDDTAQ